MINRKWAVAVSVCGLLGLVLALTGLAVAQDAERGQRGDWGGRGQMDPEQMRARMEEWRGRMLEETRTHLGLSEEEWTLVKPRYEQVLELNRQLSGPARGMMLGMRGRGGRGDDRGPAQTQPQDQTALEKASTQLREVLEQPNSSPEQIQSALTSYRQVRIELEAQRKQAHESLRELLTVRQEAILVSTGVLN